MKKIFLLLADGFELIEALTPVDVFRRAGQEIQTVAIGGSLEVKSSNGVIVKADATMGETDVLGGDAIILPGGFPGYANLAANESVGRAAKLYYETGRIVGAICGAPIVLQKYGIGTGRKVTSHSCVKAEMTSFQYTGADVEAAANLVTAIGAGHALDFSLKLLKVLCGADAVVKIKPGMELK